MLRKHHRLARAIDLAMAVATRERRLRLRALGVGLVLRREPGSIAPPLYHLCDPVGDAGPERLFTLEQAAKVVDGEAALSQAPLIMPWQTKGWRSIRAGDD